MPSVPSTLPPVIQERLAAFASRERRVRCWQGGAETVLTFALASVLASLLVWWGRPGLALRLWLSTAVYGATLWVCWRRVLEPWRRRERLVEVARRFEGLAAERLEERVLSAVQLAENIPPGTSAWMAKRTISQAARAIAPLQPAAMVDAGPMRRAASGAALGVVVLVAAIGFARPYLGLVLNPFATPTVTGAATLHVSPGSCRVKSGDTVDVVASGDPEPANATLLAQWQDGYQERLAMVRGTELNRFAQRLGPLTQGFRYRVQAGENVSPEYAVSVEGPPRLDRVRLQILPPAYTGWPRLEISTGEAEVLEGSRVTILAYLSGDSAASVHLLVEDAPTRIMRLSNNVASVEWTPTNSLTYGFQLTGTNGLVTAPVERWSLRVRPDLPPTVTLLAEGHETSTLAQEEILLLRAVAQDEVGLRQWQLVVSVNGREAWRQTLTLPAKPAANPPGQSVETTVPLNLSERHLESDDELEVWAEATDRRGQTGQSEPLPLAILRAGSAGALQLVGRLRQHLRAADAARDFLRQTRGHWLAWTRNTSGDPAAEVNEAGLVGQRLDRLRAELEALGTNIFVESGRTTLPLAPYLAGLAGQVSAWSAAQHRILNTALAKVQTTTAAERARAFARGRDLLDHALVELAVLRGRIALAPMSLETEMMAARTEQAQGAYKRALPVLQAALNWDANLQLGLAATFFSGRGLAGPPALQQVTVPSFDNLDVPKLGRENWSARYVGELHTPEAGQWVFACLANDGVRLLLDGKNILPAGRKNTKRP